MCRSSLSPISGEGVGVVVPATTVFCLVAREVCLALDVLDERLEKQLEWIFISLTYHGERMPGSVYW